MQLLFPRFTALIFPIFLTIQFLNASDMQPDPSGAQSLDATEEQLTQHYDRYGVDEDIYDEDVYSEDVRAIDVWYGPGYYYGFWFNNEPDYWKWRRNHRDYPSNRNYYHPTHPIRYTPRTPSGNSKEQNF
jgi:hypothetical protein